MTGFVLGLLGSHASLMIANILKMRDNMAICLP